MMTNAQTAWIVYFSPAGTTATVAKEISEEAKRQGKKVVKLDLSSQDPDLESKAMALKNIGENDILFIGSPTYANHPVPPIIDFLNDLPDESRAMAAAFTTYGVVSSGVTLADMADILTKKGMRVLGGIKVVAAHSMLWQAEAPVGQGRPDDKDLAEVRRFAATVLKNAAQATPPTLQPEALDYQNEAAREHAGKASLEALKPMLLPMEIHAENCIQCGVCAASCPTGNISLDFLPLFGDNCVLCFNCVRLCEAGAITNKMLPHLEGEIQKRLEFFKEPQETVAFV